MSVASRPKKNAIPNEYSGEDRGHETARPSSLSFAGEARNFYEKFTGSAERFSERQAILFQRRKGIESLTYAELHSRAESAAESLHTLGIEAGDACAILADNSIAWCVAYLGILRLGAVAVPFDTHYGAEQVATLLRDSDAKILLTTPRYLSTAQQALRAPPLASGIVLLEGNSAGLPILDVAPRRQPGPGPLPVSRATRADPAVILYTSGTTSDPKGVVLTHGNLLAEAKSALVALHVDERERILAVLPLFHALAQVANLLIPFYLGASVIFLEELNTGELLRVLREQDPTAFCCVPKFFYLIHERVLAEAAKAGMPRRLAFRLLLDANGLLRRLAGINLGPLLFRRVHRVFGAKMHLLITGGARFEPSIGRDFYRLGFGLREVYGLTETTGAAAITRPGEGGRGNVGPAMPGVELRIFPVEGIGWEGRAEGEVAVRGPIVMRGYLKRPDATAEVTRDGWFLTGDLGYLDANGRLTITGRKKEVIVLSSGKNIYPEEVESRYAESPLIKELCVLALPPSAKTTEEGLHAVIVPDRDVMRERKMTNLREALRFEIENVSVRVPSHQRILSYEIWMEDLPRTTTNKLKRYEIERRVLAQRLRPAQAPEKAPVTEAEAAWSAEPAVARALVLVREATRFPDRVRPDANLELDLGLDSIARVELLANLEAAFGTEIPNEVAEKIYTVRQIVEAVRERQAAAAQMPEAADPWHKLLTDIPASDPLFANLLEPHPVVFLLVYIVLKLLRPLAWLLVGFRATGTEHIPPRGPALLCPNHQSFLDAFLLASVLPRKTLQDIFFLGASEYYATPFRSRVARLLHIASVDPDTNLVRALQAGAFGLEHGKILVLFPEGERSINGEVKPFKKGAAILATQLGTPVVPVAIEGTFDLWPRNRPFRWSALLPWRPARVRLRFGPPLTPPVPQQPATPEQMEEHYSSFAEHLRSMVVEMQRALRARATSQPENRHAASRH
jgi:long-chain acyl-CoA synthetase